MEQMKVSLTEARNQYQQISTAHQALINSRDINNQQIQEMQAAMQDKYTKKFEALKAKLAQAYETDVKALQAQLATSKEKQQKCLETVSMSSY
jgi:hypothetical protein